MTDSPIHLSPAVAPREFQSTQWSLVLAAGSDGETSRSALTRLCETYWYPLYVFARRRVPHTEQAQDLTQAFFADLLEKQMLGKAAPERGRFRAFLLTAFKNFLVNEGAKAHALKRGGGGRVLSFDFAAGDERFRVEPVDTLTPERMYERRWVYTVLEQVLEQLRSELVAAGKGDQFKALKSSLTGESSAEQIQAAAQTLGISVAAARQAAYRLRKRFRELFRAAVAETVADESELEEEIGRLLEALRD